MNLLPKTAKQFNEADYWERFFSKQGAKAFEWYGEYHQLCSVLAKYIRPKDTILVAGCGNSTLSADMWNLGFRNLESVDISDVAVRQMQSKHADSGMVFRKMDLTNMTYNDGSFSCVLDKGTLDALFTSEDAQVVDTVERMFEEVCRVLRVGGRYICISLLQSHIIRKLLEWFGSRGWMLRVCRCREAESVSSSGIMFPVYVVICTKFVLQPNSKPLNIIESCMGEAGDRPVRQPSSCALLQLVAGQQRLAFVCHSARTLGAGDGLALELCKSCSASDSIDGAESSRRYTLHVVDRSRKKTAKPFAIFIVPHGRETEWLFASSTGRHHLADTAGFDRLLVVHLHRDQIYGTLADVQQELSTQVLQLKPSHLPDGVQVPFLTIGEDLGRREVRYRGTSAMSGRYLIEDVYSSESGTTADVYRRLVFLSNLNVVQSEAKLKPVGDKCDPTSWQVDSSHLCCRHHRYMTLGVYTPPPPAHSPPPPARVLVVGLGGGALVKFMEHRFSQLHIDVVDIDPDVVELASAWFGFNQSDHVTVHVADGIQFVQQSADKGDRYDVIFFDVDCKDSTLGMSGPPALFLQQDFLQQVYSILVDQYGMLVLNLAARDPSLRRSAQECLTAVFDRCLTYQLAGEVNQVVYCTRAPSSLPSGQVTEVITQRLRRAAVGLNGGVEGDGESGAGKFAVNSKRKVAVEVGTEEEFLNAAEFLSGLTVL